MNLTPLQFYGDALPDVDLSELQGKLIVIEGPDAVGRTTQVERLRAWLEASGHAVLDTGMARSALAGKGIQQAKDGNTFGSITMTLFYATDFADRLENEIIPALRADVPDLVSRVVVGRGQFDYWESGMDLGLARDMYESFVKYQAKLIRALDSMSDRYGFVTIDASRSPEAIFADLQRSIAQLFGGLKLPAAPRARAVKRAGD